MFSRRDAEAQSSVDFEYHNIGGLSASSLVVVVALRDPRLPMNLTKNSVNKGVSVSKFIAQLLPRAARSRASNELDQKQRK